MTVLSATPFLRPDDSSLHSAVDALSIVRRLSVAVWIFDIDNAKIVSANSAACKLWQAESEQDLFDRDLGHDMTQTVAKRLKQYQSDFLKADVTFTELWTLYPNGEPTSVMVVYRGCVLEDGRMGMQCEAVNDRQNDPENLRSAEALLHTDVMISLFKRDGPPLYLNPAARNAFPDALCCFEAVLVDVTEHDRIMMHLDNKGEHRLVTKVNTSLGVRWFDLSLKTCSDAVTGQPAVLLTAIDVSELKEARDTARHLADRDQLTDLHNRTFLQSHMTFLEESGTASGSMVILFDVDRFKLINDRHGHEVGDTVLREIAARTRMALRSEILVARLGGDEFVIVIDRACATRVVKDDIDDLVRAISVPILHKKKRIDATISVGVSHYSDESESFSDVMREADIALYASKQAGRNRITFYSADMGEAALERDRLEVALKQAVAAQEFVLFYQPRLDLKSGKIVGVEGLVRWMHPDGSMTLPDDFIPVCEETGLIDELGRMVLEIGCHQAIEWRKAGIDLDVSLNVSPRQFADKGFLATLKKIAALPDFPQGKIELEITENVLIGEHSHIAEKLRTITAIGYRIAIDDFGTGYSNLSYISRFPLTCLKIDRSFVDQLPASGPIVQLILTLGQQIGATVVSEGVETQEQLDWLQHHACDEAQGFLITKPLETKKFETFLTEFQQRSKT